MPPPLSDAMDKVADQAAAKPQRHDGEDYNRERARLDCENMLVVIMMVVGCRIIVTAPSTTARSTDVDKTCQARTPSAGARPNHTARWSSQATGPASSPA